MTTKKEQGISVVRVPRQLLNPTNPIDNQNDTDKDLSNNHLKPPHIVHIGKISPNKNEQSDIPTTKTNGLLVTPPIKINGLSRTPPRVSNVPSMSLHPETNRSGSSSQANLIIQHQPSLRNTWLKRPSNNVKRPELKWKLTGKWSHNLFSLSEDWNMCCYACACWCCFRHEISTMMNEHWCLWFLSCTPLMDLRVKFRHQYEIQGSIAEDFCLATCCPLCVALQLANEGRDYGHRIFS